MAEIIRYDEATAEWFRSRGDIQTTVCKCEACGLYYKPSLGHKCKVLEWFSRSYKQRPYRTPIKNVEYQEFMRNGINKYLGTNFTKDDLQRIYSYLGNACDHEKTIEFVNSGYDMQIIKR